MTENKKDFFEERTAGEIKKLEIERVDGARGLTARIMGLDPAHQSLELQTDIRPQRFFGFASSSQDASRKVYKHGHYQPLQHPQSQAEAIASRRNPLSYRVRDLSFLAETPEENIETLGYSFRPVQGRDRRKRLVPFVWILEAARIFAYTENETPGFTVQPYTDSKTTGWEGGEVVVQVPSRRKDHPKYHVKESHVAVKNNANKRAIVWSLSASPERSLEVPHSVYAIRYRRESDPEESTIFTFYPHSIAAYWATAKHVLEGKNNRTPWEMDPFAKPSRMLVDIYRRICNNVLVCDSHLNGVDKRRKPHIAEKSIMLARAIGVLGHDNTIFWDPKRDPKLKDYDWSIPGKE